MGIWKYRLKADFIHDTGVAPEFGAWQTPELLFADEAGIYWLSIHVSGRVTVHSGYAWDGCSPKFRLFGKLWGVSDGSVNPRTGYPYTYDASLVHDAMYQFIDHPNMPYSKATIDLIFYRMLQQAGFRYAWLYYAAVKYLGGVYRKLANPITTGR